MTSPCSVSLSRPSTEPGAWPRIARFVGSAAAPDRAAAAVEQGQLDAARAGRRGQRSPAPGGAARRRRGSPIPCSSRSSRASPPGDRRAPRGGRGRPGRRAARRGSGRRRSSASLDSNSGTRSRTGGGSRRRRRRSPARRGARARATSVTSDGRRGEADDVAVAGLDPEPGLGRGDRPERGEDLVERHARRRPRSWPGAPARIAASAAAWTAECWRTSSEARWNPNVADLPAQLGDLAPGDAPEAVGDERVLELGELGVELRRRRRSGRSAAPARRRGRPASGAAARR